MSARELLELAAKAVGYDTSHPMNAERLLLDPPVDALYVRDKDGLVSTGWNPAKSDGHSARLEAALDMDVTWDGHGAVYVDGFCEDFADHGGDKQAARRMASLKAGADRGRRMP